MDFFIYQEKDIEVFLDSKLYLTVKRKIGWVVKSKFYFNDTLILESSLLLIGWYTHISIKYQALLRPIRFQNGWRVVLYWNNHHLHLTWQIFKEPLFTLFMDNFEIGRINNAQKISTDYRSFNMTTSVSDEETNINLLMLFLCQLSQLR